MIKHQERGFSYWEIKNSQKPTYNLIFVHSFATSSDYFLDFVDKFRDRNYNCYIMDLPGFGKLAAPLYKPMAFNTMVNHICSFIHKKDLKNVVLVGHSYGAVICENVASLLYRTNNKIISRCILINPFNLVSFPRLIKLMTTKLTDYQSLAELCGQIYYNKDFINADIKSLLNECIYQEEIAASMRSLKINDLKWSTRKKFRHLIGGIKTSSLVFLSREDAIVPYQKSFKKFSKNPYCLVKTVEECGHVAFIEKSEEIFKAIDDYLYTNNSSKIEF